MQRRIVITAGLASLLGAVAVAVPAQAQGYPTRPLHLVTFKEVGFEPVNRVAYYGIEETGSLIIGNTPQQFAAQIAAGCEV